MTPELNVPLLIATMTHIESYPEEHNQAAWGVKNACGTTMCFAGRTCVLSGLTLDFQSNGYAALIKGTYHNRRAIAAVAADLLGLNWLEAEHMFYDLEGRDQLREFVDELLAGKRITEVWRTDGNFAEGQARWEEEQAEYAAMT